jgi:hypothetical protein
LVINMGVNQVVNTDVDRKEFRQDCRQTRLVNRGVGHLEQANG